MQLANSWLFWELTSTQTGVLVTQDGVLSAPPTKLRLRSMAPPKRVGLSVAQRNQNVIAAPAGKLSRQHGSSNLLKENVAKKGHKEDRTIKHTAPTASGIPQSRAVVPPVRPAFEVYCDNDDENNVIHQLEKQCQEEKIPKKAAEEPKVAKVRKPLANLPVTTLDFNSDDDVSLIFPFFDFKGPPTIRSEFSNFGMNDDDDAKSSLYGSALDFELDSRDEYVTAISEKELREDIIYANPEFSDDIYRYMKHREIKVRPKANYMSRQDDINPEMRAILVDWLSDVVQEYKMHQETLHLAVSLVDRTLSKFRTNRDRLQLIGTTAMMIASKYEEIYPPELKEFTYITDDTYTAVQILQMERVILNELHFDVGTPTSQWFGGRFARHQRASRKTINAMNMLLDLVLLDISYIAYRPSYIAAACLCYANVLTGPVPWSTEMERWSGISIAHITNLLRAIHETFRSSPSSKYRSIPQRYSSPEFDYVADLPPPAQLPL
ncbi:cyclin domain protein [Teladorsagia circumcincta]|uniref:Cyclin domain protein n=1 Tax=Teladorsagia circumcincta TaxID=45464 RepID=A0A2G9U3I6_TELCI|nr:cyclin domain protein [Teladorsagia circumcincta]